MRSYEPAQNTVEYGLLIAGVVILVLLGATFFGGQVQAWFKDLLVRITSSLSA